MPLRAFTALVLTSLLTLLGTGCKKAAAERKNTEAYAQALPEIKKGLERFLLKRGYRVYPDEKRPGEPGKVRFLVTVFRGEEMPSKSETPNRYAEQVLYEELPGLAQLDDAKKVVRIELGDEGAAMQGWIDPANGKFTGREKFGGGR